MFVCRVDGVWWVEYGHIASDIRYAGFGGAADTWFSRAADSSTSRAADTWFIGAADIDRVASLGRHDRTH
jgi:hypothetical protein